MFTRWGRLVYRFRRQVAIVAVAVAVLGIVGASGTAAKLSSGGWFDPDSEAAAVAERLDTDFGAGRSSLIVLLRSTAQADATSAAFQADVATTVRGLAADPRVGGVLGFAQTGDRRFISRDGTAAYVIVQLTLTDNEAVEATEDLRSKIEPAAGMTAQVTGFGPLTKDSAAQSERDLQVAETVSLPFAFLILVLVFGSLVAAGMPLLVAGLAIPSTLALIGVAADQREMSVYVLNVATMLGLALAIDYSLFIVSRFREELARGRSVEEAVERAIGTAGKAVTFSGIAVAIGLSGLLFMKAAALSSIGIGGALVVICSVGYALTFLPAVLGMLGHRVNALTLGGLVRRVRGTPAAGPGVARSSRWERVAHGVMARPVAVIAPVLLLLFALGSPFFRLQQGLPDAAAFPAGLESRDAYVEIQRDFPRGETTPITILLDVPGGVRAPANVRALVDYAERVAAIDGVDRVESPFSGLVNPATGQLLGPDEYVALYGGPTLPTQLQALFESYVAGSTVKLDAVSPIEPAGPAGTALIPTIRDLDPGSGLRAQVGGTAALGHDFLQSQQERLPWAIGMTLLASAVILFLLFGSIAIPIKAVIMTLLSISASFGALVWIFQDGNFSEFLGFEPLGYTIAGNGIIMFAALFGLSMDYEVLLLSRIQEAYRRTGDNRASVAEGLSRTAGVITGAALIMVTVFAAFALAETVVIKSIGVGMALAVLIDATIIRVLLVPATMRLLGDWNWWAPGALGRFAERLGFSHAEADEPDADAEAGARPAPEAG